MRSGLRVVVFGILGHIPLAGIAWQALHYLEGFRRLSCDVHYVEDTGAWPYQPKGNGAHPFDVMRTIRRRGDQDIFQQEQTKGDEPHRLQVLSPRVGASSV